MVDKTMMGDKCAELVRAAMIGALAVTLSNPTAVYAAEEETADPGQIGIEIAGEAAVGAASFDVEEDAAVGKPGEAELAEPENPNFGNHGEASETPDSGDNINEPETPDSGDNVNGPETPDSGDNINEPETPDSGNNINEPETPNSGDNVNGPETPDSGDNADEPEMPDSGDHTDASEISGSGENTDASEIPGNSGTNDPWPGEGEDISNDPWPGEGEDISNDPWPGQEEIGGGDKEQLNAPKEEESAENGTAESTGESAGANEDSKSEAVTLDIVSTQPAEPSAAMAKPVFSSEQEAARTRENYSAWQLAEAEKVTISRMPWLFHTVEKTYAIADVNSWLHVREGKGTDQKIVGILPKGSLCYILADEDSDWVYVESGDVRGFVCARYLRRGEEAKTEVNRRREESFSLAEMWIKPWNNRAYTYTYATTKTLLSFTEARGEILQYAKKFLGNPYVWGGTSLTDGCDCSGFVQQIFANFGYALPSPFDTSARKSSASSSICALYAPMPFSVSVSAL